MHKLVVLSGGHPYEAGPFAELLDSLEGWSVQHLLHPEAEDAIANGVADSADALLFYDMPGYEFADRQARTRPPSPAFRDAIQRYFQSGKGAVALHHALAGWAEWPEWADMLGGRFLYAPDEIHGTPHLDSGYRHDVPYDAVALAPDHPVLAELPKRFALCDELYLAPVWRADIPLLRADHEFVADNFHSAAQAVAGNMHASNNWPHRPESDLIAWENAVGRGRLVYLQPGDHAATYADPHFRILLANALRHVLS